MRPVTKLDLLYMDAAEARWRPSPEQIDRLLARAQTGDRAAEERLFFAFTHMVAKIAAEPFFRSLPENAGQPDMVDVIQEGLAQLVVCIRKYDTSREHRFAGYVAACVRGVMRHFATTQNSSLHVPRKANEWARAPEACESIDTPEPPESVRLHLVSNNSDVHEQATRPISDAEAFGLALIYSRGEEIDELATNEAAAANIARSTQEAAHRLTREAGSGQVARAPRGRLSPVSYGLVAAMPTLQMKQQTALHLLHTSREPIERIARRLAFTPARTQQLIDTATANLFSAAELSETPRPDQLQRAIAAHSALRERAMEHLDARSARIMHERLFTGRATMAIAETLGQSFSATRDQATQARKDLARHERRLLLLYRP